MGLPGIRSRFVFIGLCGHFSKANSFIHLIAAKLKRTVSAVRGRVYLLRISLRQVKPKENETRLGRFSDAIPHWLMVAGACLVLFGSIGLAPSNAAPLKKNLEQAAPPNPARLAREAGLKVKK